MPIDWGELDQRLCSPSEWTAAARQLTASDEPFTGPPPAGLLRAIARGPHAGGEPLLTVARAWSRPEMSRAALDALLAESDPESRAQLAWLVKHVLDAAHAPEVIAMVLDPQHPPEVRSWLVEGLERLVRGGALSWAELDPVVRHVERSEHPGLRIRVPSLLETLPWHDGNVPVLAALLDDADREVVLSAAHTLSMYPEAMSRLDPQRRERVRQLTTHRRE